MNLKEKEAAFINGELDFISSSDLGPGRNIKGMASEYGARNQSQLITNLPLGMFLGAYSYINSGGYLRDNVFIGRFCSIGRRVTIGAGMHNMYGLSTHPKIKGMRISQFLPEEVSTKNKSKYTIIESDVWIGDGVVIIPGVRVGQGAVIGANSVVTKDVEPYAVVGGVPARIIKKRFSNDIVEGLLALNWFDFSLDDIQKCPTADVTQFMEQLNNATYSTKSYLTELVTD